MGLLLVRLVLGQVFDLLHGRVGLIYLQQSFQINVYDLGVILSEGLANLMNLSQVMIFHPAFHKHIGRI